MKKQVCTGGFGGGALPIGANIKDMLPNPPLSFKIIRQGSPVIKIRRFRILKQVEGILLVELDMVSKWCVIDSTFSGSDGTFGFSVSATERSTNLKKGVDPEDWTEVQIDGLPYPEWGIFSVECSGYTIRLVLNREDM